MGASHGLTAPVLDKHVEDGGSEALRFGAASMQGWRRSQEDAHVALPRLGAGAGRALFAVFDGHGGHEVAALCARLVPELLRADARVGAPDATPEQLAAALAAAHYRIDDFIAAPEGQAELRAILDAAAAPGWQRRARQAEAGAAPAVASEGDGALRGLVAAEAHAAAWAREGAAAPAAVPAADAAGEEEEGEEGEGEGEGEVDDDDDAQRHAMRAIAFMRRHAGERVEWPGYASGCTAVCALIRDGLLLVSNAGDSRALLCRAGAPLPLSTDHKPDSAGEHARIVKAGGFVRAGRCCSNLNLSRAIGDLNYKSVRGVARVEQPISPEPEVTVTALCESDEFVLLGCDGIFEVLTNQQIIDFVRRRMPPLRTAEGGGDGAGGSAGEPEPLLSAIAGELFDLCLAKPRGFKALLAQQQQQQQQVMQARGGVVLPGGEGAAAGAPGGSGGGGGGEAAEADEEGEEGEESEEESEAVDDDGYGYDNMTAVIVDVRRYTAWWREQRSRAGGGDGEDGGGRRAEAGAGGKRRAGEGAEAEVEAEVEAEPRQIKLPRLE